jgi:hypothetical protein
LGIEQREHRARRPVARQRGRTLPAANYNARPEASTRKVRLRYLRDTIKSLQSHSGDRTFNRRQQPYLRRPHPMISNTCRSGADARRRRSEPSSGARALAVWILASSARHWARCGPPARASLVLAKRRDAESDARPVKIGGVATRRGGKGDANKHGVDCGLLFCELRHAAL